MARPKKNGTYLNVCIETPIYERLENFCKDAGHTKTVAVERALISYFDEYEEMKKKLKELESNQDKWEIHAGENQANDQRQRSRNYNYNWELVADFSNLLKSIDIPVQNIDWAHPNMRDGDLKKYNQGKPDFWKKEHQVKVWSVEYQPIGFAVLHKQEALDYFAEKHRLYIEVEQHKKVHDVTHRYYWEMTSRKRKKPSHPGENDPFIPEEIRGNHYDSWKEIANDLGYNKES